LKWNFFIKAKQYSLRQNKYFTPRENSMKGNRYRKEIKNENSKQNKIKINK
jgi:hypothetical protein